MTTATENPTAFVFPVHAPDENGQYENGFLEFLIYDRSNGQYYLNDGETTEPISEKTFQGKPYFDVDADGKPDPVYVQFIDNAAMGYNDKCYLFAVGSKTEDQLGYIKTWPLSEGDEPYKLADVNQDGVSDYVFKPMASNVPPGLTNGDQSYETFLSSYMADTPVLAITGQSHARMFPWIELPGGE